MNVTLEFGLNQLNNTEHLHVNVKQTQPLF